ncbi:MAG: hypothetical protein MJ230_05325 [bacterium]|nr:hypothetical protein [bacterium]
MAGKRNCITRLVEYIESCGVDINIGKNKARGNKGFFKARGYNNYRIDISSKLDEGEILRVLVHEFSHYIHYKNDKTLKSTEYLFRNEFCNFEEDLIKLTVDSIPKNTVEPLFLKKEELKKEISKLNDYIKNFYPDFKLSEPYKKIEKNLSKSAKYLLKYDRVKLLSGLTFKIYSIENLKKDFKELNEVEYKYILLKSKQRNLRRINSKISKLNKYYNSPTELIARSFEYFIFNPNIMQEITPKLFDFYKLNSIKNPQIKKMIEICTMTD